MDDNEKILDVDIDIYDKEEIYPNCTVQVLTNTVTGKVSVGWWRTSSCMKISVPGKMLRKRIKDCESGGLR
mgnify:CR=1 FL=1